VIFGQYFNKDRSWGCSAAAGMAAYVPLQAAVPAAAKQMTLSI
jgi:hypothetical protein